MCCLLLLVLLQIGIDLRQRQLLKDCDGCFLIKNQLATDIARLIMHHKRLLLFDLLEHLLNIGPFVLSVAYLAESGMYYGGGLRAHTHTRQGKEFHDVSLCL